MKLEVEETKTYEGNLLLHPAKKKLYVNREDGTCVEIPVTQKKVNELVALGVNTGS